MCQIYMLFYTGFITKKHFQSFVEMVQKVLKIKKYNLIFLSNMLDVVTSALLTCVYTQVSRAEVTTSTASLHKLAAGRKLAAIIIF